MSDAVKSKIEEIVVLADEKNTENLRAELDELALEAFRAGQEEAFVNLRTSTEATKMWDVSRQRASQFIAVQHGKTGMGRRIGSLWLVTQDEIENQGPNHKYRRKEPVDAVPA